MRTRIALAGAALLLTAAAAIAQQQQQQSQENPESLLPPGFGDNPTPAPSAPPTNAPPALVNGVPYVVPTATPSLTPTPTPVDPAELAKYEMPEFARRSLATVGVAERGLGPDAFGRADGQYLEALMRRLSAPLPSRWLSIALRRALVQPLDTPANVNGADFAAERAWLLLRMGESVAARSVVQAVDNDNYTPKLRQLALQTALANADPAELCPLADAALLHTTEPGWVLGQAMCAGLSGTGGAARPLVQAAKRQRVASGVDMQLAEKVIGAGTNSRQAITIEWDSIVQLTAWRWGLATATGVTVPDSLYATVGPQVSGWRALAPAIPMAGRVQAAERAAAMGVLSNLALVDLYGAIASAEDAPSDLAAVASDLQTAYIGADADARLDAMKTLWNAPQDRAGKYARLVLTARAAARVRPGENAEADRLVASMLAAGLDRLALRWRDNVSEGGDGWAMLLLADPDPAARVSYRQVSSYAGKGDAAFKQRLLFAGLAGLGRMASGDVERTAQALDVPIGADNAWTRAIDRAARERQPATVLLLAAVGMQTPSWNGVPPAALYRICGALRVVGLEGEARMIAAEALARV